MNVITRPTVAVLLLLTTLTASSFAQQKRQTPAKPQPKPAAVQTPAPTFDTLIPAETYAIYGEVRGVGQFVRASAVNDLLEPFLKLGAPPKEFKALVKWLNAHSEEVMTSRLLVAAWPMTPDMPDAIVAIEFASAEEATKFAGPLNQMLPSVFPPSAEPAPSPAAQGETAKPAAPPKPSYYLQQAGSLIVLTPKPLPLKKLKRPGGKAMAEDANFRAARNRFNSEPVFVFIDFKLMDRQEEERRKRFEETQQQQKAELKTAQAVTEGPVMGPGVVATGMVPEKHTELVAEIESAGQPESPDAAKETPTPDPLSAALTTLGTAFFSGETETPDGLGVALSFEGDSFDLRALLVNAPGEKAAPVPFVPLLIPGPAYVPEAPNILPADTELFATMSLDLPQIYAAMSKPRPNQSAIASHGNMQTVNEVVFESPFAALEQKLKLNLKDDVLPLLGSEIAVRLPLTNVDVLGLPRSTPYNESKETTVDPQAAAKASPVVLISLKDKEAMRALMPKIVDALGFKGASSFAQTERKDDTELVSYVNLFSYAFIGNFLVLSADPATTRYVVDSYLKHETLAGDVNFRSSTRWQPRPAHGQLYISPALMQSYKTWIDRPSTRMSEQTRALLTRLTAMAQPISYSLANEGFGPLHEVHIPKNLVLMAVTGISGEMNPPADLQKERTAMSVMLMIARAEEEYKKDKGAGSYGTLDQLTAIDKLAKEMMERSGYRFELTVTGEKFELTGVPLEYGKGGTMSYFIDETFVLRGADRSGAAASSSDPPIYQ